MFFNYKGTKIAFICVRRSAEIIRASHVHGKTKIHTETNLPHK